MIKFKRYSAGFVSVFLLFSILLFSSGCRSREKENLACYKKQCYVIELAISEKERLKGLQEREYLDKNAGMLFALDGRTVRKFWMKDTLIPLDMLWLDYTGQILYIEHAAVPCEKDPCPTYGPDVPASYVLEISAGQAAQKDMRVGERITLVLKNVN
ncbi:MAG: DUF192 domain-containing protein [Candidatus Omnitrophica bacterium]|nr:DUF192 domain-containing protein [Candidatus Omnitrophota bacterium]